MVRLGTLQGDTQSAAAAINDQGDVVGASYDDDLNLQAFLWHNGEMNDLSALMTADSPFIALLFATAINDSGEIVGFGITTGGDVHGFAAAPVRGETVQAFRQVHDRVVIPPGVRALLALRQR